MLNKKLILTAVGLLLSWAFFAQGNVGVGITTPQAKLDVDGGNVRFSEYGTTLHTGAPEYLLGVEADGDIVEVAPREENRGLQFYLWQGFDRIPGANNGTVPGIDVVDMRRLSAFVPASGTTSIGPPANSGLYTKSLFLSSFNSPGAAESFDGPPAIRLDDDTYILIFKGTLEVVNTGPFTFNSISNDGARMIIDDMIILNHWFKDGNNNNINTVTITLTKGKHEIEFWSFENEFNDHMQFQWGANPDGYPVNSNIEATQFIIE